MGCAAEPEAPLTQSNRSSVSAREDPDTWHQSALLLPSLASRLWPAPEDKVGVIGILLGLGLYGCLCVGRNSLCRVLQWWGLLRLCRKCQVNIESRILGRDQLRQAM